MEDLDLIPVFKQFNLCFQVGYKKRLCDKSQTTYSWVHCCWSNFELIEHIWYIQTEF